MASLIYNSAVRDAVVGNINYAADTFRVMLVTSAYAANKDTHTRRSDVTNEVVGAGYTTAGVVSAATVAAVDTANDDVEISFASINWPSSTITARGAVIYKSRGGAASADELVAYVDFGADVSSTAGTFTVTFTSPLKYQN